MASNNAAERKGTERTEKTKLQWLWFNMKMNRTAYLFLLPYLLIFTVFTVLPVLMSIFLSFTSFNMLEAPKFIGMDNYIRLFLEDEYFIVAIKNTIFYAALTGPVSYLLSLFLAWFINELTPKIRAFVTLIFYAPSIAGNVYVIWTFMFSGDSYGYVNGKLLNWGIIQEPILWFQNTATITPLIVIVALWISLGTAFLSFIAGFQNVDHSLYEAAAVDGVKNRWQELWWITLPYMRPQMLFGAVMSITGSFGFGGVITALVGFPSPDYCAHTIVHHLEDYGGMRFEMGYSSAIAVLLFFIMLGSNLLIQKLLAKVGQ